jgi:hypothetical protein
MADGENEYRLGSARPVMMLELLVTSWCNYRCAYCIVPVNAHRAESHHAFDHHASERWIAAFERVPLDFSLVCRGGEPFLDHDGFGRFLAGVGALPRLKYLRVDTNGSWSPDLYEAVPREVRAIAELNVSFHPTQISLDRFETRLARIIEAGWKIEMINYVMEASQAGDYLAVRDLFAAKHGIYVNPNPDVYDGGLNAPQAAGRDARRAFDSLLPAADVQRKTGAPTKGKSCFYPSIGYIIATDGMARRACGVTEGGAAVVDFIERPAELTAFTSPVRCQQAACLCLDRYAFLEELDGRGRSLNLLAEYVDDCTTHQDRASRSLARRAGQVWERLSARLPWADRGASPSEGRRRLPLAPKDH